MYRNHPIADYASLVDADTQFIDVRQPEEVAAESLAGTVNIPLTELPERARDLDPEKRTLLLCRSGGRSTQAAEFLSAAGFVDVVNLDGGLVAYTAGSPS